jgi:hypothetical protein
VRRNAHQRVRFALHDRHPAALAALACEQARRACALKYMEMFIRLAAVVVGVSRAEGS